MMTRRRGIAVIVCALALAAGASIALAARDGGMKLRASARVREFAGAGEVALLPSHNAGVGGWCLVQLHSNEGGKAGEGGECGASEGPTTRAPLQGPIVAESGNGLLVLKGRETWVSTVVALATAPVAAVSFQGYKHIATHASALLPDHLRGAVIELRGSRLPRFPRGHLIAWSKSGKPIPQTLTKGSPLTFGVPVRSWSNGAPVRRGVCEISVGGVAGLKLVSGGVVSKIEPHTDVRGREFLNCAHSYYLLNGKWPLDAYVLLDAADPGATPGRLPGMRPLGGHPGVFIGPGIESGELARRIAGAWLAVTAGEGISQRLTLLEHLRATLHLR